MAKEVEEHPKSYQYERAARFGMSQQGIAYALKKLNIFGKKTTFKHPKANPEAQRIFQTQIEEYHQKNQPIV